MLGAQLLQLELPWSPSVNRIWRNYRGRTVLNPLVDRYRNDVLARILEIDNGSHPGKLDGRLAIELDLYPPTRGRYDADNRIKSVLDAIEHAGLVADDEQFDRVTVTKWPYGVENPGGRIAVRIFRWIDEVPHEGQPDPVGVPARHPGEPRG